MALQAKALLGSPCAAGAEVGYAHGEAGKPGLEAGIPPSVARPSPSAHAKLGLVSTEDCRYDEATDTDQCPARARLTGRFDAGAQRRHSRSEATSAGGGALQPPGTRRKGGRRMPRGGDARLWEAMEQRVRSRPEGMKQRTQLVEPPCGTRQRWWDAGSCLMRGLEKVRTECRVPVLTYNLRRVVHLVERPRLLAALG